MKYQILKLHFQTDVHFGEGGLMTCANVLGADTLYSALCIEALRQDMSQLEALHTMAENDRIRLSDALPFIGDRLYLPKPMLAIERSEEASSVLKKAAKALKYVPLDSWSSYLKGQMDIPKENAFFNRSFGQFRLIEKASINGQKEARPYSVQVFHYSEGSGLYICIGYDNDDDLGFVLDLLDSLQYSGLGGKVSSGYGRFEIRAVKANPHFVSLLETDQGPYMSISAGLPEENELEDVMDQAAYRLVKRSGFVASETYADTFHKKKDIFLFAAGSVFQNKFDGSICDVSSGGGHPVYRYAKPLFVGVDPCQ